MVRDGCRLVALAFIAALAPPAVLGQTYSYIDANGIRTITNIPPSGPVRDLIVYGPPGDAYRPPAEPGEVPVAHVGADRHAPLHRPGGDPAHDHGIAGVEATGHVGARHHVEEGLVVGERPRAEALAEVGVEVDGATGPCARSGRARRPRG